MWLSSNEPNTTRTQIQSLTCLVGKGSGVALNCGVGCRYSSGPTLLWHRLAATAPIWPLGWELPYATDAALKKKKKEKRGNGEMYHVRELEDAILLRYYFLSKFSIELG